MEGMAYRFQRHRVPPSNALDEQLLGEHFHGRRPYDVFLIHTGAEKAIEADSMQLFFEEHGLRCFLDDNMDNGDGSPTEQMKNALETCRHAVALVSSSFLRRSSPTEELKYAFSRMKWIREHYEWETLWVVLFDLSLTNYDRAHKTRNLPDIGKEIVVFEWFKGEGKYKRWRQLCEHVTTSIVKHDIDRAAVEKWKLFLQQWDQHTSRDFPRPAMLYKGSDSYLPIQAIERFAFDSGRTQYRDSFDLLERQLKVRVHRACFLEDKMNVYYFINITNISYRREVELTHVWYEDRDHNVSVMQPTRILPKRLQLDESWETWIPVKQIPENARHSAFESFRVRISTGDEFASIANSSVPHEGYVPGDPAG